MGRSSTQSHFKIYEKNRNYFAEGDWPEALFEWHKTPIYDLLLSQGHLQGQEALQDHSHKDKDQNSGFNYIFAIKGDISGKVLVNI